MNSVIKTFQMIFSNVKDIFKLPDFSNVKKFFIITRYMTLNFGEEVCIQS